MDRAGKIAVQVRLMRGDAGGVEHVAIDAKTADFFQLLEALFHAGLRSEQLDPAGFAQKVRYTSLRDQSLVLDQTALNQRKRRIGAAQRALRR